MTDNGPCRTCLHPDVFHDVIGICHHSAPIACTCTCYEEMRLAAAPEGNTDD